MLHLGRSSIFSLKMRNVLEVWALRSIGVGSLTELGVVVADSPVTPEKWSVSVSLTVSRPYHGLSPISRSGLLSLLLSLL